MGYLPILQIRWSKFVPRTKNPFANLSFLLWEASEMHATRFQLNRLAREGGKQATHWERVIRMNWGMPLEYEDSEGALLPGRETFSSSQGRCINFAV